MENIVTFAWKLNQMEELSVGQISQGLRGHFWNSSVYSVKLDRISFASLNQHSQSNFTFPGENEMFRPISTD